MPAATYAALAVTTAAIVTRQPELALAGESGVRLAAALGAGALLLMAALSAPRVPVSVRVLLASAALAWPLAQWNTPGAGVGFTVGLIAYASWAPLLAAAAVRGPGHRPVGRPEIAVIVFAALSSVGVLGLASAFVFDPRAAGCFDCPANRLLVSGSTHAWRYLGHAGLALSAAWSVGLVVLTAHRVAAFSPARRSASLPVLLPAAAAIALFGAAALHGLDRGYLSNDPTDRVLWSLEAVALVGVAAGVASGRVRTRRARAALARLVIELGGRPGQGGLRERLASVLRDPSLDLVYRPDDGAGWIDAAGRPAHVPVGDGREITSMRSGGRDIAALVHRRGLFDDPALSGEIAVAARLAIEHERLGASRRAHLDALRKSRARIVAAADEERRRLERDLHDGAQQRLVTLAIGVRLARLRHGAGDSELERELAGTEREVQDALVQLRELAQGLFPAALDEEGLTTAVEVLAEGTPRLITGQLTERRFSPAIESTAYYVVVEALRLTSDGEVAVYIGFSGGSLEVDVRTACDLGTSRVRIEDRVLAVGGSFYAEPRRMRVNIPCES
jgi:signal transduction histidine kinase